MARQEGVDVVALSDHETTAGVAAAVAALPVGMTLVPAAEVSCAGHVHLLAYLFDPTDPALATELARLRASRDGRGREMVERLRALGVPVTWQQVSDIAGSAPVGRPHVAQALVESGVATTYSEAFTSRWIGHAGPAYAPKVALDPAAVVRLVVAAGGVAVVAHPGGRQCVSHETIRRMAAAGLAGLEVDHPEHDESTRVRLRALATEHGLLTVGGSDYHGDRKPNRLGQESTSQAVYDALVERASGAAPVTR